MAGKVNVSKYKRSTPSKPAYTGKGKKPGPKTVSVIDHTRKS